MNVGLANHPTATKEAMTSRCHAECGLRRFVDRNRSAKDSHPDMSVDRVRCPELKTAAFTQVELLVIVGIIAVLVCVLFPAMRRAQQRAFRISCTSNLKQIGLAFKTWSLDNQGRFPWQVLTNQARDIKPEVATNVYLQFMMMSNELSTPYILRCPADAQRAVTRNFGKLSKTNVSYFVGLDAEDTTPQMFLAGDRNLTNGLAATNHVLFLATNLPVGWTHELHSGQGNIGLADGSVQQFTSSRLSEAVTNTSAGGRLLMP
jgi:prepilin-type processing-associated H-X9-DG protein